MEFSFRTSEVLQIVGREAVVSGGYDGKITGLASLTDAKEGDLSFLGNAKYRSAVASSKASVLLLPSSYEAAPKTGQVYIKLENPSLALAQICQEIERLCEPTADPGIHPSAVIEAGAQISPEASIGAFCFIGAGARVGAAELRNHVSIGRSAEVGDGSILYPQVVVADYCRIGQSNRIHQGAVIGSDGYGYEFKEGQHLRIPQIGRVVTGTNVDIGANTTIDRARFGDTLIGEGTKIDNLVQIGHNTRIGKHCLLVSQVGVSGSTELGDGVVAAGQSGIAGHLKIGAGAIIGGGAAVIQSIGAGEKQMGYPSIPMQEYLRICILQRKLPDLFKRFDQLEKYFDSEKRDV